MQYKTVYRGGSGQIEEKKSRFIANIHPISCEEEALSFLKSTKKKYPGARHNCFAFTAGRDHELKRFSDDGEPQGTAGRPILDILERRDIHNCIAIVTRYFGGTLLGTGGLIRAYESATMAGLSDCVIVDRICGVSFRVTTDYEDIGKLKRLSEKCGAYIADTRYTENVSMDVVLPRENHSAFISNIVNQTGGRAFIGESAALEFAVVDGDVVIF